MTLYSLNTARKVDLEKIVEMRKGEIDHRHDMTYIYAFTTALIVKHQGATVEMTLRLNDRFTDPQKTREVERTAKDAYKDAITFFDAYVKNDFEMKRLPRNLIKPMKNTTVIDKLNLNLTQDEIEHLTTLIGKSEKQRRDTVKKREKRGSVTRDKYLEKSAKTEKQLEKLRELIDKSPKLKGKEMAQIMGVTPMRISQLKKKLKNKMVVCLKLLY